MIESGVMTTVLALDISTKTGWSFFKDGQPVEFGLIQKELDWNTAPYPQNFVLIAEEMGRKLDELVHRFYSPYLTIVVEETNKAGRFGSRHAQKILEFIHLAFLMRLSADMGVAVSRVGYINSSDWRKTLKLSVGETKKLAKPHLKKFKLLKKAFEGEKDRVKKKALKEELRLLKEDLKLKCIHGKIDRKSISVAYANARWNMHLKKGDNDIADALCLGQAYLSGAPTLTNKDIFEGNT